MLKDMKDNKVTGVDGISAEVWKYREEEMVIWRICDKVWKGEEWIEME